jgi:hypothetical protein
MVSKCYIFNAWDFYFLNEIYTFFAKSEPFFSVLFFKANSFEKCNAVINLDISNNEKILSK